MPYSSLSYSHLSDFFCYVVFLFFGWFDPYFFMGTISHLLIYYRFFFFFLLGAIYEYDILRNVYLISYALFWSLFDSFLTRS